MLNCQICGKDKPFAEMPVQSKRKRGYRPYCLECRRKYRAESGELLREIVRRYAKANGQRVPLVTEQHLREVMAEYPNCPYCGVEITDKTRNFDHVYPTSVPLGGCNIQANLVCACKNCNSSKHNAHVYTFYQRSKKFTPELWSEFVKKFYGRLIRQEITDEGVAVMTENLAAEALEHERERKRGDEGDAKKVTA